MPTSLSQVDTEAYLTDLDPSTRNYVDMTNQLSNYNEMYNVNVYLQRMHRVELDKLNVMNDRVKTAAAKGKQEYLLAEYGIHEYTVRNNIMYLTLIVVGVIIALCSMFAAGQMSQKFTIIVICVISLIYAIIVVITFKVMSNRRKYAWDQYYWNPIKKTA